ncbi:hypothetical protein [Streptomyces roseus]|uniref:hypothetical protein n=1 Tax=Streptomyces roseus TaxID=66430 RepID=UPI001428BA4A|nr:hypothetical protein [Streptomyces roseus]
MSAKLRETQKSDSAAAALGKLQRLSRNFQYLHTECGLIRTALNGLASDLAEPQNLLKQALADAAALNFTVHEDGSVSYPATEVADLTGAKKEAPAARSRAAPASRWNRRPRRAGAVAALPWLLGLQATEP